MTSGYEGMNVVGGPETGILVSAAIDSQQKAC